MCRTLFVYYPSKPPDNLCVFFRGSATHIGACYVFLGAFYLFTTVQRGCVCVFETMCRGAFLYREVFCVCVRKVGVLCAVGYRRARLFSCI